jgi:hypothetical protein
MSASPLVPLGAVLKLERDELRVEPLSMYRLAGIYSFGRGIFEREPVSGAVTSYKTLFRLHEDQFVVSRLNGWEGAVAVVGPDTAGCFVSNEYPTYAVDSEQLASSYLRWLCRWPRFWDSLVPRGSMVRRKRVHPEQVLAVEIRLPSLAQQLRVAAALDRNMTRLGNVKCAIGASSSEMYLASLPQVAGAFLEAEPHDRIAIGRLADIVSDIVHPGDDQAPASSFVGLQHIESHTGRRTGEAPLGAEKGRKFRFRPGDVLYGYLRPYLNKVWVADRHGLCSVDQYVLRPSKLIRPGLLGHLLRSRTTLEQARELTHSLQLPRLRSGLLASISVPWIPPAEQEAVEARLDSLASQFVTLAALRRRQDEAVRALSATILNQAFAGLT